MADLYQLPQTPTELSLIARQGSGSACRSLLGGYVAWDAGVKDDGSDSCARVVAKKSHWPDMRALILVVSAEKKGVSSTAGMQQTVATSELFQTRARVVVPRAMEAMERAVRKRDFEGFARVTMRESNSFHATCLDTTPPIFYLNDVSRAAIRAVELINGMAGRAVLAYTFDAGPNAVLYYLERDGEDVRATFREILGSKEGGPEGPREGDGPGTLGKGNEGVESVLRNGVSRVIETSIGDGPESVEDHLVDENGEALSA